MLWQAVKKLFSVYVGKIGIVICYFTPGCSSAEFKNWELRGGKKGVKQFKDCFGGDLLGSFQQIKSSVSLLHKDFYIQLKIQHFTIASTEDNENLS